MNFTSKKGTSNVYHKSRSNSIREKDPKSKFQSVTKLILSKIDNILEGPPNIDSITDNTAYSEHSYSNSIKSNKDSDLIKLDPFIREKKVVKHRSTKPSTRTTKNKVPKETFMTDVGIKLEKQLKIENDENKQKVNKFLEDLKEIDDFIGPENSNTKGSTYSSSSNIYDPDFLKLINEIDSYKSNLTQEMDDLQYMINYVKTTDSKISRHINGVKNVFTQSGMKPANVLDAENKNDPLDKSFDSENEVIYDQDVYDKTKNLGLVRENLFGIQDKVITYYTKFDHCMNKLDDKCNKIKTKLSENKR